ncbi:MAG: MoxR family ATPase [Deltaproteobacteria bacterium]|nr:MoxR family ATPase [Deltaproteobacteria bacterium]
MFKSIDEVGKKLADQNYISDKRISTVIFLAAKLGKPVLIEGPAGVGKTDLSKVVAAALGRELVRLQCYEGLDEAKALYEWEYAKQLLYTQILKDKISEVVGSARSLTEAVDSLGKQDDVFFSERFLLPRPLLQAISSEKPVVLLVDEIDKADPEFEAFLLEVLSDFQVTVPELGSIKARHQPLVFLTSNNTRELSDALKRRCLHLFIDYPEKSRELEIVRLKVPEASAKLANEVVDFVGELRKKDLKKIPSISETLDWARALTVLNARSLGDEVVKDTLSAILKYEGDVLKAQKEMASYIERQKAKAAVTDKDAPSGDPRKDFLN